MRILCITNLYPPYVLGGYEQLAHRVMRALEQRGHEVCTATGRGDFRQHSQIKGIYAVNLETKSEFFDPPKTTSENFQRSVFSYYNYRVTKEVIREFKPDIVSIWNLWQLSVSPMVAAHHMGIPTVTHLTDHWLLNTFSANINTLIPRRRRTNIPVKAALWGLRRLYYRFVNPRNLLIPSQYLMQKHLELPFGFPPKIFSLMPHGIDVRRFPERTNEARDGQVKLLYVGQLWEGKGVQVLLRALGQLRDVAELPQFCLSIYGYGTDNFMDFLQTIIEQEKLQDVVKFEGTVPYEELPNVYRSHDILIFPSIWGEPFALVPLEAMSSGLAVIATSSGGTAEAVLHEETGLIVPPNDSAAMAQAITRMLTNEELRLKLGKQAAKHARENYNLVDVVNRIEAFYDRVIHVD